ncbi:MAG: ParB/RepB/Spo0J family partition protein [Cyanobacteria bacterium J06621_11]
MYGSTKETQPTDTIPQLKEEIESLKSPSTTSFEVPISRIIPLQLPKNMQQPRLYFDAHKMELLRDSIHKHGVLEPVLLRPSQENKFELISGERRWRCCQSLGMTSLPGIVRQMSDSMALEAAIIAHLLSEEISLIEQTESILSLLSLRLNLSLEELKGLLYQVKNSRMRGVVHARNFSAQQIEIVNEILSEFGMKLSSFVANRLPLLNLAPPILSSVREGKLSPTNAVLVNRQPQEFHAPLMAQAAGKTKGELATLIKSTVPSNKRTNRTASESSKGKEISEQIYNRIKFVRKRTELLDAPDVLTRLTQIDALLQEIESLGE